MPVFPSVEWFDALRDLVNHDPSYVHIGTCDAVVGIHISDLHRCYLVTFEVFECSEVRETNAEGLAQADFWLEMDYAGWRDMIENIRATNGHPDSRHSLNTLNYALAEPFARGEDGLKLDLFYRYNQSFQHFFNSAAKIDTVFAGKGNAASERSATIPNR
ncbi:MAG: hypothetical protein Q7S58_13605 [Candidatus Binatus sp.]|uniref:hypothetical protein n=1 Tax=Candidatus Binatus sp. TaxID=2811406 RepID=UPI002724AFCF|nr:hypothetical protein [Candidatus Binatus sp.]MDO8433435.1 hypothetical protein [Candidatus Binatus sp.]